MVHSAVLAADYEALEVERDKLAAEVEELEQRYDDLLAHAGGTM